jgi:hypothetical protein
MIEIRPTRDPLRPIQWLEGVAAVLVALFAAFLTYLWWAGGEAMTGLGALILWATALSVARECRRTWRLRVEWARQEAQCEAMLRDLRPGEEP